MKRIFGLLTISLLLLQNGSNAQAIVLKWKLHPQEENTYSIKKLSKPGLNTSSWITAVVPGTVFYAYVKAGKESNPDYGENIYKVDKEKYNRPFWYRTEFSTKNFAPGKRIWLNFNGIHKRGEIYLNGNHIGTIKGIVERGLYD